MREGLSRLLPLLLVALFCVPLFVGLGRTDLQNDEAIYSFAVDRIVETGDWLTPRSSPDENAPFFEKPPLKFWIVAAPLRLGLLPRDEFGLRFWDAVFGSAALLYVVLIGSRLAGPLCGLTAAAVLFVHTPLVFEHGLRSNNMEAALVLAYCGGVHHFLAWTHSRRRLAAAAVALYFVLGFMTKFVAAAFLPLVLGMAAGVVPEWRRAVLREWRTWLAAAALAAGLIVPWFVYEHVKFGSAFWNVLFGVHVFQRMTVSIDPGHLHPWNYYLQQIWAVLVKTDTLPLVIAGAALLLMQVVRRRDAYLLIAFWAAVPLLLISISPSKIYHYAYPYLPPIAIAAGLAPAWLWRAGQPRIMSAAATLDDWMSRRAKPLLALTGTRSLSYVLLGLAAIALGLAVVAAVAIPVRWRLAPHVVLRNAAVLRPWMLAFVLAALAGRSVQVARLLIPLVVLALMPWPAYRATLGRLPVEHHPQREARDCLLHVVGGEPLPGVYAQIMEGSFLHSYYFYFRRLGPWEWSNEADDSGLYANLWGAGAARPVLVSDQRYSDFRAHLRDTGNPRAEVSAPMVRFADVLLLLPGRFSACSADARIASPRRETYGR